MAEKNRGIKRMVFGGMLCIAGIVLALDGGREAEMALKLIIVGAALMLMGAIVSGLGAVADAIRGHVDHEVE